MVHCLLSLAALSLVLSLSAGCRKKVPAPSVATIQSEPKKSADSVPNAVIPDEPPSPPLPAVELPLIPKAAPSPTKLELGEKNFRARQYANAAQLFDAYLKTGPNSPNRDHALFYCAVSHALSKSPDRSPHQCEKALKQLISEFPDSLYRGPAELVLDLQMQVQNLQADIKMKEEKNSQLSEELRKLKEIDLKRRPSRLPE